MRVADLPRPLGLVLSGGASLGATQIGMLRALEEAEVRPDLVVGTSAGAINGALVAADPSQAADRLEEVWKGLDRESVFPESPLAMAMLLARTRRHVFSNDALGELITAHLPVADFADLDLPFGAVATDVVTGHAHLMTDGDIASALLASAAIPAVYPRVQRDGRELSDGGLTANVPVRQALAMGAKSIVVLDAGQACHRVAPPAHVAETIMQSAQILMRHQVVRDVRSVARRVCVVHIPPLCVDVSPFDFSHRIELMAEGYAVARRFLAKVDVTDRGLFGGPHRHEDGADTIDQRAQVSFW